MVAEVLDAGAESEVVSVGTRCVSLTDRGGGTGAQLARDEWVGRGVV